MFRNRCTALLRWRGPKRNRIIGGPTLVVHDRSRDYTADATKTGDGSSVPLHHHHHNDTEVQKFSNMSQQWWDIKYNPLIAMNPIRIQFIQQCIQQYLVRHDDDNSHDGGEERNIDRSSSSLSRQCLAFGKLCHFSRKGSFGHSLRLFCIVLLFVLHNDNDDDSPARAAEPGPA